jgi:hypothetical protein
VTVNPGTTPAARSADVEQVLLGQPQPVPAGSENPYPLERPPYSSGMPRAAVAVCGTSPSSWGAASGPSHTPPGKQPHAAGPQLVVSAGKPTARHDSRPPTIGHTSWGVFACCTLPEGWAAGQ